MKKKITSAFTLIEVLVSITIIGIMSVSLLGLFGASLRSNVESKETIAEIVYSKSLMEKTKSDLKKDFKTDPGIDVLKTREVYLDDFKLEISCTERDGLYLITVINLKSNDKLTSYIYFPNDSSQ